MRTVAEVCGVCVPEVMIKLDVVFLCVDVACFDTRTPQWKCSLSHLTMLLIWLITFAASLKRSFAEI